MTLKEIGDLLGMTSYEVLQHERRAFELLSREL
jgi:DNA-directed RNA polymerase specialized sigma subunit